MPIFGTRPEAIKMAPLILALQGAEEFECLPVVTGQHRAMLDQVNEAFGVVPVVDLDIFEHGMTPSGVIEKVLNRLTPVLEEHKPDAVVVQGDTTSALAAGLAAFNSQIPVVHLEAGLRTESISSPFPEEGNRRLLSQVSALHLAPTAASRQNLLNAGIPEADIAVTGNTVIDALQTAVARGLKAVDPALVGLEDVSGPIVLVTSHRRESWGAPMERTARALVHLARTRPEVTFVFPLHANPRVRETFEPALRGFDNVRLTESLTYTDLALMLSLATLVVTDSGGIQEEAPALGKPVLVIREDTERPEAIDAGVAKLLGTDTQRIIDDVNLLLDDSDEYDAMAHALNPFGDGKAASRAVAALAAHFGVGERLPDFDYTTASVATGDSE